MRGQEPCKKTGNGGFTMIIVLVILTLIAMMGILSMTTAFLNLKMRKVNQSSDQAFYNLELALDEIYAQMGRRSSEILKEEYAKVLEHLYQPGYETNEAANEALKKQFVKRMKEELQTSLLSDQLRDESDCQRVAEHLKECSSTIKKEDLELSVGSIFLNGGNEEKQNPDSILFKQVQLLYLDPKTDMESALTVDITIQVPYVKFINEGDTLFDYILVANQEIQINEAERTDGNVKRITDQLVGSIYGDSFTVNQADVEVKGKIFASAGNLNLQNQASLSFMPLEDGYSHIWVNGIELSSSSELTAEQANLYVADDLTLEDNENLVTLSGNYYGYGNEGTGDKKKAIPNQSSAILLNDKNSSLDFSGLDSLMLAGRAYLRFREEGSKKDQYVYPMGESLAVRGTQSIYLIPAQYLSLETEEGEIPVSSNPIPYPDGKNGPDDIMVQVKLPDCEETYNVSRAAAFGESEREETAAEQNTSAVLILLKGKIYVYYNFDTEEERSEFFEQYLEENTDDFEQLLKQGGMSGVKGEGRILLNKDGRIASSGTLYQVSGEGAQSFELLKTRKEGISDSLSWVEFGTMLASSFEHIKDNLAETNRVRERREKEAGTELRLPAGNYIRLNRIEKELKDTPIYKENVFLYGGDILVKLNGMSAELSCKGKEGKIYKMDGGLIASSGDIIIEGNGSFQGLFISGESISIEGNAELTADAERYEPVLNDKAVSKYFYDYGSAEASVLNEYQSFVFKENWNRSRREKEERKR